MRRRTALIGVVALAAAACGGSSTPPSASSATPSGTPAGHIPVTVSTTDAHSTHGWPTYHRDTGRSGRDTGGPTAGRLRNSWRHDLDGAVYAEPIVVGRRIIVATENNTVYAFNPTNGKRVWKRHLGSPVPLSSLPCGNIDPTGITGTPAYDAATHRVFVVTEQTGSHHVLYGLDIATGKILVKHSVDPPNQSRPPMQQRAALLVAHKRVYVAFGGRFGDCGDYHGHVVALSTSGNGRLRYWRVPTSREAGIWATPGPTIGANGDIYVSIGNGASSTTYDGSDSITELSPTLKRVGFFAPSVWRPDNLSDLDLGSMGPAMLPNGRIFIAGKRGIGYLLKQAHLGGVGGQVASHSACRAFGGAARNKLTLYLPCDDGLRSVHITASNFHLGWHAASNITGSPVIGGGALWSVDPSGGRLYELNLSNGHVRHSHSVGPTPRFATPTLWGGRVYVGTLSGIVALRFA